MNGQRSALGILLDATELMIARDVSQGRNAEEMRRALDAAHAALTHIATAVGLTPPTDLEKLKAAVTVSDARRLFGSPPPHVLASEAASCYVIDLL